MSVQPAGSWRRRPRGAGLVLALLLAAGCGFATVKPAAAAGPAAPETVQVAVDHAKVVRLPAGAQTVVVGNPSIADVSVQRNGVMIVTGKGFGVTNLIALDSAGLLLAESLVRVGAARDSVVTVQRGMDRESYSCTPQCQPSMQLGDSQIFFRNAGDQIRARNGMANGATP